jgi:hypothetical protein
MSRLAAEVSQIADALVGWVFKVVMPFGQLL